MFTNIFSSPKNKLKGPADPDPIKETLSLMTPRKDDIEPSITLVNESNSNRFEIDEEGDHPDDVSPPAPIHDDEERKDALIDNLGEGKVEEEVYNNSIKVEESKMEESKVEDRKSVV